MSDCPFVPGQRVVCVDASLDPTFPPTHLAVDGLRHRVIRCLDGLTERQVYTVERVDPEFWVGRGEAVVLREIHRPGKVQGFRWTRFRADDSGGMSVLRGILEHPRKKIREEVR